MHKIVAGRARDLEDVRSILLKRPDLDLAAIRGPLAGFESALGAPLVQRFDDLRQSTDPS